MSPEQHPADEDGSRRAERERFDPTRYERQRPSTKRRFTEAEKESKGRMTRPSTSAGTDPSRIGSADERPRRGGFE